MSKRAPLLVREDFQKQFLNIARTGTLVEAMELVYGHSGLSWVFALLDWFLTRLNRIVHRAQETTSQQAITENRFVD